MEIITQEEFETYKQLYRKIRPLVLQKYKEEYEIRTGHRLESDLESNLNLVDYNEDLDSFDIYVHDDFINWNALDSVDIINFAKDFTKDFTKELKDRDYDCPLGKIKIPNKNAKCRPRQSLKRIEEN